MKNKYILLLVSAAVIGMTGCQNGKMEQAEEGRNTHRLVISAYADTETKTSVTAVSGGYQVSWNVGDQILLHECAPEAGEDDYDAIRTYESQELAADDLSENMAAEQKARAVYENLINAVSNNLKPLYNYYNLKMLILKLILKKEFKTRQKLTFFLRKSRFFH